MAAIFLILHHFSSAEHEILIDIQWLNSISVQVSENKMEKLGFRYEKDVPYECSGGDMKTIGKLYQWKK